VQGHPHGRRERDEGVVGLRRQNPSIVILLILLRADRRSGCD
jgi:hypothetical protein